MIETPRTDHAIDAAGGGNILDAAGGVIDSVSPEEDLIRRLTSLSRDLERELAEAQRFISEGTGWIPVGERLPREGMNEPRDYVLAVDAKGRMSVGYIPYFYSGGEGPCWTFAKQIGAVTHWMPLPEAPK